MTLKQLKEEACKCYGCYPEGKALYFCDKHAKNFKILGSRQGLEYPICKKIYNEIENIKKLIDKSFKEEFEGVLFYENKTYKLITKKILKKFFEKALQEALKSILPEEGEKYLDENIDELKKLL